MIDLHDRLWKMLPYEITDLGFWSCLHEAVRAISRMHIDVCNVNNVNKDKSALASRYLLNKNRTLSHRGVIVQSLKTETWSLEDVRSIDGDKFYRLLTGDELGSFRQAQCLRVMCDGALARLLNNKTKVLIALQPYFKIKANKCFLQGLNNGCSYRKGLQHCIFELSNLPFQLPLWRLTCNLLSWFSAQNFQFSPVDMTIRSYLICSNISVFECVNLTFDICFSKSYIFGMWTAYHISLTLHNGNEQVLFYWVHGLHKFTKAEMIGF